MKKIVISGANGFIGSWLIKGLSQKGQYQIWALVRKNSNISNIFGIEDVNIVKVDYDNTECLEEILLGKDVFIHLIGQMGAYGISEEIYEKVNIELTEKMLALCEKSGVKQFIFCSTPGVQGFGHRLAKEEDAYAPRNPYEKTKMQAELSIIKFCHGASIKYTIIRPDFVYGPGDYRRVKMYRNIQNKKFVLTTSGKSYLHPTYILDVVQGFEKSIGNQNAFNEIFNISAEKDVTALEYLNAIADYVQSSLIHINVGYGLSILSAGMIELFYKFFSKKEAFVSKNKIDFLSIDHSTCNEKAKEKIDYHPEFPIRKGMSATIEWCRQENLLN
ncbi:MAG TPA: NAD(P)-dependent oxidoreductase [Candidatus Eisenbergiella merdipullorum]|uniref:NAD(P)-dependent oxidoreductase n=1 Tax=Candidatus Eisenbergiella merdipullorum TaxID=2838553 RepID=A0A9D2I670_9FIRM|nr:NAD(P)-dependent oxidoreductase [Candidatus Eisenbergiella merdipullorum]